MHLGTLKYCIQRSSLGIIYYKKIHYMCNWLYNKIEYIIRLFKIFYIIVAPR